MELLKQLLLLLPEMPSGTDFSLALQFFGSWIAVVRWIVPDITFFLVGASIAFETAVPLYRGALRLYQSIPFI